MTRTALVNAAARFPRTRGDRPGRQAKALAGKEGCEVEEQEPGRQRPSGSCGSQLRPWLSSDPPRPRGEQPRPCSPADPFAQVDKGKVGASQRRPAPTLRSARGCGPGQQTDNEQQTECRHKRLLSCVKKADVFSRLSPTLEPGKNGRDGPEGHPILAAASRAARDRGFALARVASGRRIRENWPATRRNWPARPAQAGLKSGGASL